MNLLLPLLLICQCESSTPQPDASFDIWDWTAPCQNIDVFKVWVQDLKSIGFTQVEFSVPWKVIEPRENQFEMDWLRQRLDICVQAGMTPRLRINSYYDNATPSWYEGERWKNFHGETVPQNLPSICDERFWQAFTLFSSKVAEVGKDYHAHYSAFIGIHAELKFADWWSYDNACLDKWKSSITTDPRPEWLLRVIGKNADLPEHPPIPLPTQGVPDTNPTSLAWIAFREQCWREAVLRFNEAIRDADPHAIIYAPLGESYRRSSADMSNLDYWGLSRGADLVQHSYDFFWHIKDPDWMAAAAVSSFRGITGLPVSFEYDAEESTLGLGYTQEQLLGLGKEAAKAGATLKVANYSYSERLPSEHELLKKLLDLWKVEWKSPSPADIIPASTVLVFISKWTNYCYREPTEWLHTTQFGLWKMVRDLGYPTRIICEDNLSEDLSDYLLLVRAYSPDELLPESDRQRLNSLPLPIVSDLSQIPAAKPRYPLHLDGWVNLILSDPGLPIGIQNLSALPGNWQYGLQSNQQQLVAFRQREVILGYPIGYHGSQLSVDSLHHTLLDLAMKKALSMRHTK